MGAKKRTFNPIRWEVGEDGVPRMIKRCSICGKKKVVDFDDRDRSDFYSNGRSSDGVRRVKPYCKSCTVEENKKYQQNPEARERRNARHAERMATDPEYRKECARRARESAARERKDPARLARTRKRQRDWKAQRREESRDEVNELQRMDYRLRLERMGISVSKSKTVVDGTLPRIPVGPFRAWLEAWMRETGITENETAAAELGIPPARLRSYRFEQDSVAIDVVDRVLLASIPVNVDGVWVERLDDLYPYEEEERAA